jgi:hypothetical protein
MKQNETAITSEQAADIREIRISYKCLDLIEGILPGGQAGNPNDRQNNHPGTQQSG